MKHHHNLTQISGADMPTRYTVDGVRVSEARFNNITRRALCYGSLDCFSTKSKQMAGGKIRRWNYSCARWEA
jgi:hypothetical protein